jgi:serine/threonine-protein kinase
MNRRVGNYEIIEKIGRGAFGRIYRARQLSMDREVALKLLPLRITYQPRFVDLFLREARLAAGLNHPNIVTVFDVGRKSGRYFYAMEYVDGTDLARLVLLNGPAEPRLALDWMIAMAQALEHAHGKGVVHHDVKPANMLLDEDGRLLLGDFGVARAVRQELDPDTSTSADAAPAGRMQGSPGFMPPEVARGQAGDGRSDLYGLGASFFLVLTGRNPYRGTPLQVLAQHVRAAVPAVRRHRADCPRRLAAIVESLMAKDPDHRPQTAADLHATLERLRDNWSMADRPVTNRRARRRAAVRPRRR